MSESLDEVYPPEQLPSSDITDVDSEKSPKKTVEKAYEEMLVQFQQGNVFSVEDLQEAQAHLESTDPSGVYTLAGRRLLDEILAGHVTTLDAVLEVKQPVSPEVNPDSAAPQPTGVVNAWLAEHIGQKNLAELPRPEHEAALEKLAQGLRSLWQPFFDAKKWELAPKKKHIVLGSDKYDVDSKFTALILKYAGLEQRIVALVKDTSPADQKFVTAPLVPGEQVSRAEVVRRVCSASGLLKPEDELPLRVGTTLANGYVTNSLFTSREQFEEPASLRGLQQYLDAETIVEYTAKHLGASGAPETEAIKKLLDRPILENDELRGLQLRYINSKSGDIIDRSEERRKMIKQAQLLLDQPDDVLRTQGRLLETPEYGRVFVNVAAEGNKGKNEMEPGERQYFPAGAAAVKVWKDVNGNSRFNCYLNMDVVSRGGKDMVSSMLLRVVNPLRPGAKRPRPNLPPGIVELPDGFLKPRGGEPWVVTPAEIARRLGPRINAIGILASQLENNIHTIEQGGAKPVSAETAEPQIAATQEHKLEVSKFAINKKLKVEGSNAKLVRSDGKIITSPLTGRDLNMRIDDVEVGSSELTRKVAERYLAQHEIFVKLQSCVDGNSTLASKILQLETSKLNAQTLQSILGSGDATLRQAEAVLNFMHQEAGTGAELEKKGNVVGAALVMALIQHEAKKAEVKKVQVIPVLPEKQAA